MKKITKVWAIWTSVEAIILFVGGLFLLIFGGDVNFQDAIGIIVAMFIILDGGLRLLSQFMEKDKTFSTIVSGVVELSFGIFICLQPHQIIDYINTFVAILLFVIASILAIDATIRVSTIKNKLFLTVIEYVTFVVLICGGVLIFIFNTQANQIILQTVGGLVIIGSLFEIGTVLYAIWVFNKNQREQAKEVKKEEKENEKKKEDKNVFDASIEENKNIKEIDSKDIKEIEKK